VDTLDYKPYNFMKSTRVNLFEKAQRLILLPIAMLASASASVDAAEISAGNASVLYLTDSGDLYAWGANSTGQLGDGTQVTAACQ